MRRLIQLLAPLALGVVVVVTGQGSAAAAEPGSFTVMTYNLRYASPRGENAWPLRRPVARALWEAVAPDLVGTQEGLYSQLGELADDLPRYRWIGLGREGGSRGEFMAVFYRPERWEPREYDHYWLSDTPETIGSASWGNQVRRMVTWVRFHDRQAGRELYFINTHLDHQVQAAREKSAALLVERTARLDPALPRVLVGDFNAAAGTNPVYARLVNGESFRDAWLEAPERGPDLGTFHDYAGPRPGGPRIDWILLAGAVRAHSAEVVTFAQDGQYPSDHFPVRARLEWTDPAASR